MSYSPLVELEINRAAQIVANTEPAPRPVLNTGTVTGVREDGTVNVRVNGTLVLGSPCSSSYRSRLVGDQVSILLSGDRSLVVCEVGGDPDYLGPEFTYSDRMVYMATGLATSGSFQQSCSNVGADTVPRITAWGFWNGSSNDLVDDSAGATTIRLYFARSADDSLPGTLDKTLIVIQPHGYNTLPASGFAPLSGYPAVNVSLQCGEAAYVALPNSWKTAIQADTIRGFCTQVQDLQAGVNFAVFSDTSGSYSID